MPHDSARATAWLREQFVDGTLCAAQSDDIDEYLKPSELLAVERYRRAEVPRQFTAFDGSQCATLVVWTRGIEKSGRASRAPFNGR